MIPKSPIERLVYAMVILLALVVLALIVAAPPDLVATKSVYQGF